MHASTNIQMYRQKKKREIKIILCLGILFKREMRIKSNYVLIPIVERSAICLGYDQV